MTPTSEVFPLTEGPALHTSFLGLAAYPSFVSPAKMARMG